jgi:hypothetical protein
MTSQHDDAYELRSSEDTADGAYGAGTDAGPSIDTHAAESQRTYEPGDDELTESKYIADSGESTGEDGLAESGAIPGDIIVAEVIDESPDQPVSSGGDELAETGSVHDAATAAATDDRAGNTHLSQEWRDIQAAFVDDPAGAVQLAADATDAALSTLIDRLRRTQSALMTGHNSPSEPDTEQLRAALRDYRTLTENVDQIGRRLVDLI